MIYIDSLLCESKSKFNPFGHGRFLDTYFWYSERGYNYFFFTGASVMKRFVRSREEGGGAYRGERVNS